MGTIVRLDWKRVVDACSIYVCLHPRELAYLDLLVEGEVPPPNGFGEKGDGLLETALHLASLMSDEGIGLSRTKGKGQWVLNAYGLTDVVDGEFVMLRRINPAATRLEAQQRVGACITEFEETQDI